MTNTPVAESPSWSLFVSEEVCEDIFSAESDENKQCIAIEFPYHLSSYIMDHKYMVGACVSENSWETQILGVFNKTIILAHLHLLGEIIIANSVL